MMNNTIELFYLIFVANGLRFMLFDFISLRPIRVIIFNILNNKLTKKFLTCPFCQGFWCGLFIYILYYNKITLNLFLFGIANGFVSLLFAIYIFCNCRKFEEEYEEIKTLELEEL